MLPQQPELTVPSAVGLMLVALVVNLVTVLLVVNLMNRYLLDRSRPSPGAEIEDRAPGRPLGAGSDTTDRTSVRCRECETVNDPDYRYCRACVARLPSGAGAAQPEFSSFGRFAG